MTALQVIAAEIRALDTSRRALRNFGLVVGGVFAAIAALVAWRNGWTLTPWAVGLGGPALVLMALGLVAPGVLHPVYKVWMGLAVVLGFVMTRVILTVVFVGLVIPIGLVLRLVGKDLLRLKLDPAADSYWLPKEETAPAAERMTRYF